MSVVSSSDRLLEGVADRDWLGSSQDSETVIPHTQNVVACRVVVIILVLTYCDNMLYIDSKSLMQLVTNCA